MTLGVKGSTMGSIISLSFMKGRAINKKIHIPFKKDLMYFQEMRIIRKHNHALERMNSSLTTTNFILVC